MCNRPKIPAVNSCQSRREFVVAPPIAASRSDDDRPIVVGLQKLSPLPSWLVSFVLHLAFFLMLASIVIPYSRNSRLSVLQFAFSEKKATEVQLSLEQLEVENVDQAETPAASAIMQSNDVPEPPVLPPSKGVEDPKTAPVDNAPQIKESIEKTIEPIRSIVATAKLAFEIGRNRKRDDDIVDRFIAYDLGRLSGDAGRKARREFEELGPNSIPSLVRGLNQSARYHASCPVGVISRKLKNTLKDTSNQRLIEYAINHVGEGVTDDMPHSRSVFSVRRWIADRFVDSREQIVRELKAEGLPSDRQTVDQVLAALDLNSGQLLRTIDILSATADSNELVALLAAARLRRLSTFPEIDLGMALSKVIENGDPLVGRIAGEMLSELAPLAEFEPGPNTSAVWQLYWQIQTTTAKSRFLANKVKRNRDELPTVLRLLNNYPIELNRRDRYQLGVAATNLIDSDDTEASRLALAALTKLSGSDLGENSRSWNTYWKEYKKIQLDEPSAMAKYRMGVMLLKRGKRDAAVDYLNQVMEVFPETAAAERASQGLEKIANTKNVQ